MAVGAYIINREFDFARPAIMDKLPPVMVEGNENAHQLVITCKDGGEAADLSAFSCRGVIVNGDRKTFQLQAHILANVITVPLGQAAYLASGPAVIMVDLYKPGQSMTIYRAETTVQTGATAAVYDPAQLMPTVPELMAYAQAALDSADTANAAALNAQGVVDSADIMADGTFIPEGKLREVQMFGRNCNHIKIQWNTANKLLDSASGLDVDPTDGQQWRTSKPIAVSLYDFVKHNGSCDYVYIMAYDAADTFLGYVNGDTYCKIDYGFETAAYVRFTCRIADMPSVVIVDSAYRHANGEAAFFDRSTQAYPVMENHTGGNTLHGVRATYDTPTSDGGDHDPWYPGSQGDYHGSLIPGKTFFFIKIGTPDGALVYDNPENLYVVISVAGEHEWALTRVGSSGVHSLAPMENNWLVYLYLGPEYPDADFSPNFLLSNLRDGSGKPYTGGIRVEATWVVETGDDPAMVYDIMTHGNKREDLAKYAKTALHAKYTENLEETARNTLLQDVRQRMTAGASYDIVSTDANSDPDDLMALRMLQWAERVGLVNLLAVTISDVDPYSVPALDAFFQFGGRNVKLGINRSAPVNRTSAFLQPMAANWPHKLTSNDDAEDHVVLLRKTLAAAPEKVNFIVLGSLVDLQYLLLSAADSVSPLTGAELVAAKVSKVWVMGGLYPTHETVLEFNFSDNQIYRDAAAYVCANCPVPMLFVGFYQAAYIKAGQTFNGYLTAADDPLYEAFVNYGCEETGRAAFDPRTVLAAIYEDPEIAGYDLVYGTNSVDPATGKNTFTESPSGNHAYLVNSITNSEWYEERINDILWRAMCRR